jgi:hypothetical protein
MASNEIEILDPAVSVEKLKKIAEGRALNRRRFITALGMTSAAAGAGLISGCSVASNSAAPTTPPEPGQISALNFVLNFKYLESTFYSYVTQGADLSSSSTYDSGAITGAPAKLTFSGTYAAQITDLLNEIYYDETNHVSALRSLLGSAVVARPAINLAAYGAITSINALSIARLLEDVGATALAGATALLTGSGLTFVMQILGVESFHAGALRLVNIQNPSIATYDKADSLDVAPVDPGTPVLTPLTWAGPTAAGGFFATSGGVVSALNTTASLAVARTSSEVLAIVYAKSLDTPAVAGTTSGGFFPNGVNGLTNTV